VSVKKLSLFHVQMPREYVEERYSHCCKYTVQILKESARNRKFLTVPGTYFILYVLRQSVEERNYHHQSMTDTERIC
jgi:hypothetical protein